MWTIHTIICILNISIQPFCSYGGKLPITFTNYNTCDIAIYSKLDLIENNHLKHMQKDIDRLNYILWAIGFMVATQFIAWILRMLG